MCISSPRWSCQRCLGFSIQIQLHGFLLHYTDLPLRCWLPSVFVYPPTALTNCVFSFLGEQCWPGEEWIQAVQWLECSQGERGLCPQLDWWILWSHGAIMTVSPRGWQPTACRHNAAHRATVSGLQMWGFSSGQWGVQLQALLLCCCRSVLTPTHLDLRCVIPACRWKRLPTMSITWSPA